MRHSHSDIDFGDAKIASVSIKTILCMVYLISHGCMLGSNSMLKKKKSFLVVHVRDIYFLYRGQTHCFIGRILGFI